MTKKWLIEYYTKAKYLQQFIAMTCYVLFLFALECDILALRATSHAFCGAKTPTWDAKKDSYPGESKANPVCFDVSRGSCAIA